LVVPDYPRLTAIVAIAAGSCAALLGYALSPMTQLLGAPQGGEVVMSAMSTVFILAGVTVATLGVRMRQSRTFLALEREELTVSHGGAPGRDVVRLEDIERVGIESSEDAYRAHIVVRGGRTIALGQAMTSSRSHYERVVTDVRRFLQRRP
jgi:hypothetical protein